MVQQKVHTVLKTRADQGICGGCGVPLLKGDAYLWWPMGFRSGLKGKRCLKPECYPKPSALESSMLSELMAYQEQFDVSEVDTADDIDAEMQTVLDCCLDLAERYRAAGTNARGEEWRPDMIEKADALEQVDKPDLDEEPQVDETEEEWLERIREEATQWVSEIELPT